MSAHDLWILLLGLGAGAASGFLNTAAAAGSAVCLPILMLIGLDPITANATNAVALAPASIASAFAYRRELGQDRAILP